jgi:hypothetical protein
MSLFRKLIGLEPSQNSAVRQLPAIYIPQVPASISIQIVPSSNVMVYAVEESPPAGWTASNINLSGTWDTGTKKVRWGPYFDNTARIFTYSITAPIGESGARTFSGIASFDSQNIELGSAQTIGSATVFYLPYIRK